MRTKKDGNEDEHAGTFTSRRETLMLGAAGALAVIGCGATGEGAGDAPGIGGAAGIGGGAGGSDGGISGAGGAAGGSDPEGGAAMDAVADGAMVVDGDGSIACVVKPEQIEGPYFVDEMLNRSDIRSDPSDAGIPPAPGAELRLTIGVYRAGGACEPVMGAVVDIWQCDAFGVYSDAMDPSFDTRGQKFLRGYQKTDGTGSVTFVTIYPGWYPGRAVHIHFKIRTSPEAGPGTQFTSQLYFDDAVTDQVFAQTPYDARGIRTTRNGMDAFFGPSGADLVLAVTKVGPIYQARFDIGLAV
jgi:protocatechuate 3,4-dioxygenase beta subunit